MTTKRMKTFTTYRLNGDVKALPNHKRASGRFMEKASMAQARYHDYHSWENTVARLTARNDTRLFKKLQRAPYRQSVTKVRNSIYERAKRLLQISKHGEEFDDPGS